MVMSWWIVAFCTVLPTRFNIYLNDRPYTIVSSLLNHVLSIVKLLLVPGQAAPCSIIGEASVRTSDK